MIKTAIPPRRRKLKTHFDACIHFFTRMDAEMIGDLLDASKLYQGFDKSIFVRKLGDLFVDLYEFGDTYLKPHFIFDKEDSDMYVRVNFEGNRTKLFLEVVFVLDEDGYVLDIFECDNPSEDDFNPEVGQRVFIDQFADGDYDLYGEDEDLWTDNFDDELPF